LYCKNKTNSWVLQLIVRNLFGRIRQPIIKVTNKS
jgi:hypothetical protein